MRVALLLCCVLAGLAVVAATTSCPSSGIICPSQCSTTWQQCDGTQTYSARDVPPGTVCCNGAFVYPNDPCCGSSTVPSGTACPDNGVICSPQCGTQWVQCTSTQTYAARAVPPGTVCYNGAFVYPNDPNCAGSTQAPTTAAPTTAAPTTKAPTTAAPTTTKAPTTAAPTTKAPTTAAPTTAAPTTAAPTTAAPTTVAPTTKAPTTAAPTTAAPTTAAPTTATPTTAAPTTAAPTTAAPTTAAPTTAAPTTAAPTTQTATTTSGSCTLAQIFTQADFAALFPNANLAANRGDANQYAIFNYDSIIKAAAAFPAFGCTGTLTQRLQELAAFLGQTSQETSGWWSGQDYIWGYVYSTELCAPSCGNNNYCDPSNTIYPCVTGQGYYGRGPIQLSWNFNYGAASLALTGDKNNFLNNPNQVLTDSGVTAFKTALWFWMTAQAPKPSCHDVMTGGYTPSTADVNAGRVAGYGLVTDIINGGIECGISATPSAQSTNRVGYYTKYATYFKVPDTTNLYCNNMQSY